MMASITIDIYFTREDRRVLLLGPQRFYFTDCRRTSTSFNLCTLLSQRLLGCQGYIKHSIQLLYYEPSSPTMH